MPGKRRKRWSVYQPRKWGNRWQVRIRPPGGGEGGREEYCKSFATRGEAIEFRNGLIDELAKDDAHARAAQHFAEGEAALAEAETVGRGRRTVIEAIDAYEVARREAGRVNGESIKRERYHLEAILRPLLTMPVAKVSVRVATARYRDRTQEKTKHGKPLSAGTHHGDVKACRALWKWLLKQSWAISNPWAEVELIGKVNRGKGQLRQHELTKVRDLCVRAARDNTIGRKCARNQGAVSTLIVLYCGLRCSEVIGLEPRDVDRVFTYVPAKQRENPSEARSKLPDDLAEVLRAHAARCVAAGQAKMFPHDRHWVRRQIRYWCKRADVPVITAHGLRGTHATVAAGGGATAEEIARQLNHSSTLITKRHYMADRGLDTSADIIADELGGESETDGLAAIIARQERELARLRALLERQVEGRSEDSGDGTLASDETAKAVADELDRTDGPSAGASDE